MGSSNYMERTKELLDKSSMPIEISLSKKTKPHHLKPLKETGKNSVDMLLNIESGLHREMMTDLDKDLKSYLDFTNIE
jgi:hypothetical protein